MGGANFLIGLYTYRRKSRGKDEVQLRKMVCETSGESWPIRSIRRKQSHGEQKPRKMRERMRYHIYVSFSYDRSLAYVDLN